MTPAPKETFAKIKYIGINSVHFQNSASLSDYRRWRSAFDFMKEIALEAGNPNIERRLAGKGLCL